MTSREPSPHAAAQVQVPGFPSEPSEIQHSALEKMQPFTCQRSLLKLELQYLPGRTSPPASLSPGSRHGPSMALPSPHWLLTPWASGYGWAQRWGLTCPGLQNVEPDSAPGSFKCNLTIGGGRDSELHSGDEVSVAKGPVSGP